MRILASSLLASSLLFTGGCATAKKVDDVLVWTQEKLSNVDATIGEVREKYDAKLIEIEDKQAQDVISLEQTLGRKLDIDGDLKVSIDEAKQAYLDLAKGAVMDPEKRKNLLDPNILLTLLMAVLGVGGGGVVLNNANKKGTKKAVSEAVPEIVNEVRKLNGQA